MTPALLVLRLGLVASVVLLVCGVTLAWSSASFTKRVAGVIIALSGAIAGLAVVGAPQAAMIAGAVTLFAYAAIGVGVLVRLQEDYGGTEIADIDRADAESEPPEPVA